MKVIGIGTLATDYYYVDKKCVGRCGGMTAFNIIANLSKKFETYAIGTCGNDIDGRIAVQSLKDLGVNTKYISLNSSQTRCFNITIQKKQQEVVTKKICPICGEKKWMYKFYRYRP